MANTIKHLRRMFNEELKSLESDKELIYKGRIPKDLMINILFEDDYVHNITPSARSVYKIIKTLRDELPKLERVKRKGTRKIIFKHGRALGDGLMFTAGIRDFKLLFPEIEINVESNQSILWENNPYINRDIKKNDKGVEFYKVGYPAVGNINNAALHFSLMFLFDMIAIADAHEPLPIPLWRVMSAFSNGSVGDPSLGNPDKNDKACEPFILNRDEYKNICENFARMRGDIHLTEKEMTYNMIEDVYDITKYWIIAPGGKRDCTSKIWDWRKFQDVINYYDGLLKFVVVGRSDHLIEKLRNVIDLTDKFNDKNLRDLIPLVYHAQGCVSGPSFLMHLAAATPPKRFCYNCNKLEFDINNSNLCKCNKPKWSKQRKPCVVIHGGREPATWSSYTNQQVLHSNGALTCCDNGGCWTARATPLQKDPKHNKNLCEQPIDVNGRTIPTCMNNITSQDVIRGIEKYYDGNLYKYEKNYKSKKIIKETNISYVKQHNGKEINLLGNLNSSGGGEQSFFKIARMLKDSGWKVNLHPWSSVNDKYKNNEINISEHTFEEGMIDNMVPGVPLLFYANDRVWDFEKQAEPIVAKSSCVIIGINFANGSIPKSRWLNKTGKLKAVVFQNHEKCAEFERDMIGFDDTERIVMFGAIKLDSFLEVLPSQRKNSDTLVILKHCKPDYRKYVTEESARSGDKIHLWQKNIIKEPDIKFYNRLLKDIKNVRFEFMEAHNEVIKAFKGDDRMIFHKWDSISVEDFLSHGHIYLYRTSNMWRDQYPRVVAEALAVGLPVLTEPRDGTKDRVDHGNTGFYCIDYDGFKYAIKMLQRKENYRYKMGMYAKDWARKNLDPTKWVDVIERIYNDS